MKSIRQKQQFITLPLLQITIGLFIFSFLFNNNYLSPKIMAFQTQGESFLIKENIYPVIPETHQFTKTAYAFTENIGVDGNEILKDNFNNIEDDDLNLLVVVDDSSFLTSNNIVNDSSFLGLDASAEYFTPITQRSEVVNYIVQQGDSPGKIAVKFGINLNTILWANNLNSKSVIQPGQELIILPISGVYHQVKKGETLSAIADKYKASVKDIVVFNGLKDEKSIQAGQDLMIPGGISAVASKGSTSQAKISTVSPSGLMPMTEDTSSWPQYDNFFAFPVSGGWTRGELHYYNAVDITNSCGSPIYASADGIVTEAKGSGAYNLGYGNIVKILHQNGTMTMYCHFSEVLVKEGDKVYQGDLIGRMGDTGNSNGCHLHFEVRGAKNPFAK